MITEIKLPLHILQVLVAVQLYVGKWRRGWGEEWEEGVGRGVGGGVGERSGSSSGVTWLNCRSVMPFPPPSCVCVIHSYFSFYHIQKTLSGEGEGGRYLPEGSIREPAPDGKL